VVADNDALALDALALQRTMADAQSEKEADVRRDVASTFDG
jgi:hypothetical protein